MAGDDRFLASGHYGSDSISKRLNQGWSPGGENAERYSNGTMDAETRMFYERLILQEMDIDFEKRMKQSDMNFEKMMKASDDEFQEFMKRAYPNSLDVYQSADSVASIGKYLETRIVEPGWNCRSPPNETTYKPIGPSDVGELDRRFWPELISDSLKRHELLEMHVSRPHYEMGHSVDLMINHTFSEDLKNVVSVIKDSHIFHPEVASLVEDMRKICQDDEALSAMCIYISVCSKWDHVPPKMKEAIERQPWGKRGEDAMKTYQKFLANTPTLLSPVVAVELKEKLTSEYESHVKKSGLEIMGPKTNLFDKMPNSPQRRPSLRSGDRSYNESQPRENQLKRAKPQQTSPKRAHTPPSISGSRTPLQKRPHSTEIKQEPVDLDEAEKTIIQQNLLEEGSPPSSVRGWRKKSFVRVFRDNATYGNSLINALNEKYNPTIQPDDGNPQKLKKRRKKDAFDGKMPSWTVFEKIKDHLIELFLPGIDIKTCGTLEEQLDNVVKLFKMLQKPWSPVHIREDPNVRCESDTEDDTNTTGCIGGRAKDWPKCFLEMIQENAMFLGKGDFKTSIKKAYTVLWGEFFMAFKEPEQFLLCFTRAITKKLDKYCADTDAEKYRGPVFYPNYVEMALIKQARRRSSHKNKLKEKEAEVWSTILGITFNEVRHRLAVYRAKEVEHVDYTLDTVEIEAKKGGPHQANMRGSIAGAMRGGLATSHMGGNNKNQPQEYLGQRGYFEIPEEIQALMRRWLIDNGKNLTDENRFDVDARIVENWRDLLKDKYPGYTSSLTDGVIRRYMHLFQERNRAKFPNLSVVDLVYMGGREYRLKMEGSP